jgi:ribosome recycling factor
MIEETYQDTRERMGKTITALENELKRVARAGLPSLLDGIGWITTAPDAAEPDGHLSVPESRLITIQPWDASVIKDIEKPF